MTDQPDPKTAREMAHRQLRLRILATTDLHMHLTSFDYGTDQPDPMLGLTRTASLIADARRDAGDDPVLLFDNGDGLQGTPLEALENWQGAPARPHPLMQAFGQLEYDAVGLGNHDFNFGLEALAKILADAPCPVVASNLIRKDPTCLPNVLPDLHLDRMVQTPQGMRRLRIGVLSLLPPQIVKWDAHLVSGRIHFADILETARDRAAKLREAGCDLVIALAHSGLNTTADDSDQENVVIPLAACDDIDAIIAGHTHLVLPGPSHAGLPFVDAQTGIVHDTPTVMAGFGGSHLGCIDLELTHNDTDGWRISGRHCAARPIARRNKAGHSVPLAPEDPALTAVLADIHTATRTRLAQPIAHMQVPVHSYFSFAAPDPSLHLIAKAQAHSIAPSLRALGLSDLPLLSAVAPSRFGGRSGPTNFTDIPKGPITQRHIENLIAYPNHVHAIVVTGAQILDWLEVSASVFNTLPAQTQTIDLINPDWPGHAFDVLYGLTYQFDLSIPPRFGPFGTLNDPENRRVTNVAWQGHPLRPDQRFVVALSAYRANGGGNVAALDTAQHLKLPVLAIRDVVRDWLADPDQSPGTAAADPVWSIVPSPGQRCILRTGPEAAHHMDALTGYDVRSLGLDDAGFLQLSLAL